MPRARNPNRERAFGIYKEHGGKITNREIAKLIGENEKVVAVWKQRDQWANVVQQAESCTTKPAKNKGGAPKGNRNAAGNIGGGPIGNSKGVTHGFFRKIFPPEALPVVEDILEINPMEMIWQNIVIQYTAIVRAQRIMFVQDATDHSEFVVGTTSGVDSESVSKMVQPAWDKHANFLQAQSRAMKTLESLMRRYEAMLPDGNEARESELRIEKLKAEIDKLKGVATEEELPDDGFIDALKAETETVWDQDSDE